MKHFSWWSPKWSHVTISMSLFHGEMEKAWNERRLREGHRWGNVLHRTLESQRLACTKNSISGKRRQNNKYDLFQRKGHSWPLLIFLLLWPSFTAKTSLDNSLLNVDNVPFRSLSNLSLSFCHDHIHGQKFNMWQRGSSAIQWTISQQGQIPTWRAICEFALCFILIVATQQPTRLRPCTCP